MPAPRCRTDVAPVQLARTGTAVASLAAVSVPTVGWAATAGLVLILVTLTACVVTLLWWFTLQTPQRRHDVIELVKAVRCRHPRDRMDPAPPTGDAGDGAGC